VLHGVCVSTALTMGLWNRIPLKAWMVSSNFCSVLSCVGRGLAAGWSLIQRVPPAGLRDS
jgi:hypothetical protein